MKIIRNEASRSYSVTSKETKPMIEGGKVVGIVAERRLFGVLLQRKTVIFPTYYGITEWDLFQTI